MDNRVHTVLDRSIEILRQLVGYPTISADSNMDLIDYAVDLLEATGARPVIITDDGGAKANVFATIGPDGDDGVVLSGHTDVVPVEGQEWRRDPFVAAVDGTRVWGRGTTDMKGFIACVLAMIPRFSEVGLTRPVHVALTHDEEEGCHGAKVMLADLEGKGIRPATAIIGEPTRMQIVGAHKGCHEFTTEIVGVERHASLGAGGAGAIHGAARFIALLDSLAVELTGRARADSPFEPAGSTINVGTISGGVARNITAGSAVLDWEIRPVQREDVDFVLNRVERYVDEVLLPDMRSVFPSASVSTTNVGEAGGLLYHPDSEAIALASRITGADSVVVMSFGTEAGLFQESGISTVVCGPGDIEQAHKPDEYVEISELESCLGMLERLVGEVTG